jgi:hypothetical protein
MDCVPSFLQWLPIIGSSFVAITSIILHFLRRRDAQEAEKHEHEHEEQHNRPKPFENGVLQEQEAKDKEQEGETSKRGYSISIEDILRGYDKYYKKRSKSE